MRGQIEYMVVAFNDNDKDARLSLRQSEILAKLAHVCDDLPCGPQNAFVKSSLFFRPLTKR
jgi:glutamate--cysteine ligase catalytic subunit